MSRAVAIVPAAGASRRMGRDKLLLPWRDTVVIGSVLEALTTGGAERTMIVVSPEAAALEQWIADSGGLSVVNPSPERGMLSSIQEGLEALGGAGQLAAEDLVLLVCPGDLPQIDAETVTRLIELVVDGAALAVPSHRGRRGHPLAISPALAGEVAGLDPEIGLRQLVDRHRAGLVELQVESVGVVRDLDTPGDYEAALEALDDLNRRQD